MCTPVFRPIACLVYALGFCVALSSARGSERDQLDHFENHVRPLLLAKCAECHGDEIQESGLRVDSREALLAGGQRGPAVVPGDAESSLLLRAVRGDEEEMAMPPEGDPLTAEEQAHLARWINEGAVWSGKQQASDDTPLAQMEAIGKNHWAYRPIELPEVPAHEDSSWPRGAIDHFVLDLLVASGLKPSPEADRRALIRRVTFDLLGLPPTEEEIEAFLSDPRENAYELLIEGLLVRKEYGQRWGRHWLDVARYSDTRGHTNVPGTEIRYPFAWTYRDYVIEAFNDDLPFDQFVSEQLAADLMGESESSVAALGFLTVGRRFLNRRHRILGERVDLVSRGFMGITIMCAKCHDHKFDPFSMHDFYALYGIFENAAEPMTGHQVAIGPPVGATEGQEELLTRLLQEELEPLEAEIKTLHRELIEKELQTQAADYLAMVLAQSDPEGEAAYQDRLAPRGLAIWQAQLETDAVVAPVWKVLQKVEQGERYAERLSEALAADPAVNRYLREEMVAAKPESRTDAVQAIGGAIAQVYERWTELQQLDPGDQGFSNAATEAVRQLLDRVVAETELMSEAERIDWFLDRAPEPLRSKYRALDSLIVKYWVVVPQRAMGLKENPMVRDAAVHIRGNPKKKGAEVRRKFYGLLTDACEAEPVEQGSGRVELARWITHPGNPLTARVIANRIWGWHFGQHLVDTPSDFGTRSSEPTHPALLDYLATHLRDGGWSIKDLHRQIMHSATYRQQSLARPQAMQVDPENRLYWRKMSRRLEFEPMRDAMLAASGELDTTLGGPPTDEIDSPRRSVYLLHDRRSLAPVLPTFDVPVGDATLAKRSETTVPQQALYLMNSGFVTRRAEWVARRVAAEGGNVPARITALYRRTFGRDPSAEESRDAAEFIAEAEREFERQPQSTAHLAGDDASWTLGSGLFDPETKTVFDFEPLPHFDGVRWWQTASRTWQDANLSATGGRPGRRRAIVRRWRVPSEEVGERYILRGTFQGGPYFGDGVEIHVVSSRRGLLKSWTREEAAAKDIHIENLEIEPGDHIDLVVDSRGENAFDEFSWSPRIVEVGTNPAGRPYAAAQWRSEESFRRSVPLWQGGLDPWEQLAQVLLMSNEFMFVD